MHEDTRPDRPVRVPWAAVAVFVVIAFALAWLAALPLWLTGGPNSPLLPLISVVGAAMMFTPAIATLVVVFVMKTPRAERLRFLGMSPLRPAKRVVWFTVAAVFVPPVLVLAITLLSGALGLVELDLIEFSGFAALIDAQVVQLATLDPTIAETLPPISVLVIAQLVAIPVGALINSVFAFGEELGWRGWLLPALLPLGTWPALLISGVIWGLWHSPLILLGYNFGLLDWRGVALMVGGCVAWGVLFGWSRLRTGSVWPAVVGHGALNAAAGLITVFAASGAEVNTGVVGPLGMVAWSLITVLVIVLVLTGQFRAQPELAPRRARPARLPREGADPHPTDESAR